MEDFRSMLASTQTDRFRSPASFAVHERLSPSRLTMTSNVVGASTPPSSTLKEEYEDKQRLERQNFDLKLKVFHLEESIKKLQDVEVRNEVSSGIVRSEVSDLRLQLEEKDIELEQRNLLLMKAKAAIESMRNDLDNSRKDLEKQYDLEERVKRLKQMNDDIELDYKNQLLKLETELNSTRQSLGIREQEKSMLEEKVRQVELTVANLQDTINKQNVEKGRMDDRWMQSQQRILALEEELTQARAHIDLYKMQAQEANDETEAITEQLKDLALRKKEQEEAHRQHVQELSSQYDAQVRAIRANHEQDVDKLRASHAQLLQDLRDNYQKELQQARAHMERTLADWKAVGEVDTQRVREEFQQRLVEKAGEARAFQAVLEADRAKFDTLAQELEACRQDGREKAAQLELLRREAAVKAEELRLCASAHAELLAAQRQLAEAQDQLRVELLERTQLRVKLEQAEELLRAARQRGQELEAQVQVSRGEAQRLAQTSSDLGAKAEGLEGLVRENEKWRLLHGQLQTDVLEAGHRLALCAREKDQAEAAIARGQADLREAREQARELGEAVEEQRQRADQAARSLQLEREARAAAEAALNEQRAALVAGQKEAADLRERLRDCEGRAAAQLDAAEHRLHALAQASAMARRSLLDCDHALTSALEGDAASASAHAARDVAAHHSRLLHTHAIYGASFKSSATSSFAAAMASSSTTTTAAARRPGRGAAGERLLDARGEDYDVVRDLADRSGEEVRHELAVLIERVCLKLDRLAKIRAHFDACSASLSARLDQAGQQWAERCALLTHRVDQSAAQAGQLRTTLDRDRAASRRELDEVKKLREVLLAEHAGSLRQHEERYAQLLLLREKEKVEHEHLQRAHERLAEELSAARGRLAQRDDELRGLDRAEAHLADCERRLAGLSEAHQQLLHEAQAKEAQLQERERAGQDLHARHAQTAAELEAVAARLRGKEDALLEAEARVHRLHAEVERLRSRQIDPDLAHTLRASHEQVRRAEGLAGPGPRGLSAALAADLKDAEAAVRALLRKSDLLVDRLEACGPGGERQQRLQRLHEEVRHLLGEHRALLLRVEGLLAHLHTGSAGGGGGHGLGSGASSPSALSAKAIAAEIAASAIRRPAPESPAWPAPAPGPSPASSSSAAGRQPPPAPAPGPAPSRGAASGESHYFPSRRGLLASSMASRDYPGGHDFGTGPSIQLDDLRDGSDLGRHRSTYTRPSRDEEANGVHKMSRMQQFDHSLKTLTQKLDGFDLGKLRD